MLWVPVESRDSVSSMFDFFDGLGDEVDVMACDKWRRACFRVVPSGEPERGDEGVADDRHRFHLSGHRRGAYDALFGAAMVSGMLGVLGEVIWPALIVMM
jgi:hypothetical protein